MAVEQRLPRVFEAAVSRISSEETAKNARKVCRQLFDGVILPGDRFGDSVSQRYFLRRLSRSGIIGLAYANQVALDRPPHMYDPLTGKNHGTKQEDDLKKAAVEANRELERIAVQWEISGPGELVHAVLALTDSLISEEETV